jgi:glycine/D-amino acid oxidase-like deaminating enzyme
MQTKTVAIIGSGVVGLSTAISLLEAGYKVTLIDKEKPGQGASFGNAGLFADYACLPFTKFALLKKMPGMLLDSSSPLSMQTSYLPNLVPYGLGFIKSCTREKYEQGKQALTSLQKIAYESTDKLLRLSDSQNLVKANGCLALIASEQDLSDAKQGDMLERQQSGVRLDFLSAHDVSDLEPDLARFYAGGVFYPDTRFTVSPVSISQNYARYFSEKGGVLLQDVAQEVIPDSQRVAIKLSDRTLTFDQVVICAGVASKALLKPLGFNFPLVSERGYHLTLDLADKQISRPVGWLDKAVFLTPMADGVRLAGTAEFAHADAPAELSRTNTMLKHASTMLGNEPDVVSSWVGSRPSTPDSLPVIGTLKNHPRVNLAFGHGHLGLTFAAATGQLIKEIINNEQTSVDITPFAPERFS